MILVTLVGLLACLARVGEGLGVEVEDVTGRQLEAALETENLLAVMFCKFQYLYQLELSSNHVFPPSFKFSH